MGDGDNGPGQTNVLDSTTAPGGTGPEPVVINMPGSQEQTPKPAEPGQKPAETTPAQAPDPDSPDKNAPDQSPDQSDTTTPGARFLGQRSAPISEASQLKELFYGSMAQA